MRDTQILSTLQELSAPNEAVSPLVFDACSIGVVLRAVLFVEIIAAIGVMYVSHHFTEWLYRFAWITAGALPATLAWLLLVCAAQRWTASWKTHWQYAFAVVLGALCGWYASAVLWLTGLLYAPSWWASTLTGLVLAALLVAALVMRAKGRTPANTAARLSELQSRIRPHFLFNTLNSAIALVRAEPATAERVLEDLSELFRRALMETGDAVSVAQEIDLAQRYLAIEQVRFGHRLRAEWKIDPRADLAQLPPLLLQPLVENAVRHGVEPSETGADIQISTECRGTTVVIKVLNSVPAGQGVAGHGLALNNVRQRLTLLHDVQGHFSVKFKDGLYQIRMEVPL
jgi:two-component system, LytTR family, sensor histidine kinase AlgZ